MGDDAPRSGGVACLFLAGRRTMRTARIAVLVATLGLGALVGTLPVHAAPARSTAPPVEIAQIAVGLSPTGIAVDLDRSWVYVANVDSNVVSVINGANLKVIAEIPVGAAPYGVWVNGQTDRVYVTNSGSNTLSVIDGNTNQVIDTIGVGSTPRGVGVDPNDNHVFVANAGSDTE